MSSKCGLSRLAVFVVLAMLFSAVGGNAQLTQGYISGSVTDSQDKVMSNVDVTITNQETNISRSAKTNEAGVFRFVAVPPGVYSVDFSRSGFETKKVADVQVSTSQEPTIKLGLKPVATPTTVTVTVDGVELNKTNATVEMTLNEQLLTELPVGTVGPAGNAFSRDVIAASILAPGTNRAPGQNGFASNGQRSRNAGFMIDGVDNNDPVVTQAGTITPPEAVRELHIQTMPFSAEFGRNTGPLVNVVTRNGTNQFHTEAWNYYRGNWLEPVSLVNKRALTSCASGSTATCATPRFVNNQFGGSVGGPIISNKTFFFGLIQGNLLRRAPDASSSVSAVVPTPAGYAALQTVPLRAGQTQASRDAVLQSLSFLPEVYGQNPSYGPTSTLTYSGVPVEIATITSLNAPPSNLLYNVIRLDHQITKNDQIYYRYHFDNRNQPDSVDNLAFGPRWAADSLIRSQTHSINYTKIMGSLVNEARVAYIRRDFNFPENDPLSPTVQINTFFTIGGTSGYPQRRLDDVYQFQNVSTLIRGKQSFKFGLDVRRNTLSNNSGADTKGTWTFASLEEFLNNNPVSLKQTVSSPSTFRAVQWSQSYFFQDDVRLTRDLTVGAGLRYEYSSVPLGMYGTTDPLQLAAGIPAPVQPDKNNWAPRLSFAYSPTNLNGVLGKILGSGKSSIRGGFAVSYDVLFENILIVAASTAYPGAATQLLPDATVSDITDVYPTLLPAANATVSPFSAASTFQNVPSDAQNPTTYNWTLSVQRKLNRSYIIEVGYAGSRSYHMIRQSQANPAILTQAQADTVLAGGSIPSTAARRLNPAWGSRVLVETTGRGAYHAGYVRFDKQLSRGLLVGANYTYSAMFSDSDEAFRVDDATQPGGYQISPSSPHVPQNFYNYGNDWARSVYDRPHRLSVHYVYEVPWFAGTSTALRNVFGGWQISGFSDFQSGQPFTMRVGVDTLGNAASSSYPPGRPNYNPGGIMTVDPVTHDLRTFTIPVDGTGIVTAPRNTAGTAFLANTMPLGGNVGRNTFRGPGFQNWNIGIMKKINLQGVRQLQLRADMANVWNHNNFQNPESNMSSANFGKNVLAPITDTRQIQLSAKLRF